MIEGKEVLRIGLNWQATEKRITPVADDVEDICITFLPSDGSAKLFLSGVSPINSMVELIDIENVCVVKLDEVVSASFKVEFSGDVSCVLTCSDYKLVKT